MIWMRGLKTAVNAAQPPNTTPGLLRRGVSSGYVPAVSVYSNLMRRCSSCRRCGTSTSTYRGYLREARRELATFKLLPLDQRVSCTDMERSRPRAPHVRRTWRGGRCEMWCLLMTLISKCFWEDHRGVRLACDPFIASARPSFGLASEPPNHRDFCEPRGWNAPRDPCAQSRPHVRLVSHGSSFRRPPPVRRRPIRWVRFRRSRTMAPWSSSEPGPRCFPCLRSAS